MTRLFIPEPLSGREIHALLAFHFGEKPWRGVFNEGISNYFEKEAVFVDTLQDADAILLPHNFKNIDAEESAYINAQADEAEKMGVPIFAFAFGDLNDGVVFDPRVRVFRLSVYKSTLQPNDVVIPTTAESFIDPPVRKKTDIPSVSFCGYAGQKSFWQKLTYYLKHMLWELRAWRQPILRARKQGIYWRKRAMQVLLRSPLVRTNFIIRRSFSGALRTIELAPEVARAEFIKSIQDADFVLSPKGDGNYSNRFLETLSLGRIPVLIDTDVVLPLEDEIDYSKIIVRVPMSAVKETPQLIRKFYDVLSPQEWEERQRLARKIFDEYLRQDVFFRRYFADLKHRT
ncbi:hypothetical protein EXS62_02035 [Candidatus Kaiserbacteria bacterium]|nr:hypothetical protein [Candidatus Kaiserbacteria bacterium]